MSAALLRTGAALRSYPVERPAVYRSIYGLSRNAISSHNLLPLACEIDREFATGQGRQWTIEHDIENTT